MKKIYCSVLFILTSIISYGQQTFISPDTSFETQSHAWRFTGVIYIDSAITKDKLFQKSKQWFSETFISSKNVIDNADKDEGVIYGHATITMNNSTYGYVCFNIEIRCKDGKVKYLLNDFVHKDGQIVNAFGGIPIYGGGTFNIGSLVQKAVPERIGYNQTGRGEAGREKLWNDVKTTSKITAYNLIQSLKSNISVQTIKEKDTW